MSKFSWWAKNCQNWSYASIFASWMLLLGPFLDIFFWPLDSQCFFASTRTLKISSNLKMSENLQAPQLYHHSSLQCHFVKKGRWDWEALKKDSTLRDLTDFQKQIVSGGFCSKIHLSLSHVSLAVGDLLSLLPLQRVPLYLESSSFSGSCPQSYCFKCCPSKLVCKL